MRNFVLKVAISSAVTLGCAVTSGQAFGSADTALTHNLQDESPQMNAHLHVYHRVRELRRHPAFAGRADLLIPHASAAYDNALPLSEIGSHLVYHTNVHPQEAVSALNRMIDDVNAGENRPPHLQTRR